MPAGSTSQTVTHLDKLETVLPGCFLCFQGDSDHYIPVGILMILNEDFNLVVIFQIISWWGFRCDDNEV